MTIGISKERLMEVLSGNAEYKMSQPYINAQRKLLKAMIDCCEELNTWLPIEKAPKDRLILLFDTFRGVIIGQWYEGHWVSSMIIMHDVTHYQELPGEPE